MLYDSRHVTTLQPLDEKAAEKYNPFHPPEDLLTTVTPALNQERTLLETIVFLITILGKELTYDEGKTVPHLRNATQTWNDKKGNCFEQEGLLLGILEHAYGKKFQLQLYKGYSASCTSVHDISIHPAIRWSLNTRETYISLTWGDIFEEQDKPHWYTATRIFSREEFIASYLISSAEKAHLQGRTRKALAELEHALDINPNDYTAHCEKGWAYGSAEDIPRARESFEQAITIAPRCMDVRKEYGDYLNTSKKKAPRTQTTECLHHYREALTLDTFDLQTLLSLEKRFRTLGQQKDSLAVRERIKQQFEEHYVKSIIRNVRDSYRPPTEEDSTTIIIKKCSPRESKPETWIVPSIGSLGVAYIKPLPLHTTPLKRSRVAPQRKK